MCPSTRIADPEKVYTHIKVKSLKGFVTFNSSSPTIKALYFGSFNSQTAQI